MGDGAAEAVDVGTAKVLGSDRDQIEAETVRLLKDRTTCEWTAPTLNPDGDGYAAERIVETLFEASGIAPEVSESPRTDHAR